MLWDRRRIMKVLSLPVLVFGVLYLGNRFSESDAPVAVTLQYDLGAKGAQVARLQVNVRRDTPEPVAQLIVRAPGASATQKARLTPGPYYLDFSVEDHAGKITTVSRPIEVVGESTMTVALGALLD